MVIDHDRERLIEAIAYFALNVKKLGKTKLFKLIYFLDFQHFKETGRSVTGLDYFAWPKGPVPRSLYQQLQDPPADLLARLTFTSTPVKGKKPMLRVGARGSFDAAHFTRRQLRLLESIAREHRDADAQDMIEATHLENQPWHKVFEIEGRRQELIPYTYALRAQDLSLMTSQVADREATLNALKK